MKKIAVIAVHPDDETLGCGGTLLKHKAQGDRINCIFVTSGNNKQRDMIPALATHYGFEQAITLDLPEIALGDMPLGQIIAPLSEALRSIEPDTLYIPNRSDAHSDHRRTFEALIACTKSFRYPFLRRVLMCEVISETDFAPAIASEAFVPNHWVDISDWVDAKRAAMRIFAEELLSEPKTRSLGAIEALERYRGSQINAWAAESFMILKSIE